MTAPRVLDDGARVGFGLLAFLAVVWAMMASSAVYVAARAWKRFRRL